MSIVQGVALINNRGHLHVCQGTLDSATSCCNCLCCPTSGESWRCKLAACKVSPSSILETNPFKNIKIRMPEVRMHYHPCCLAASSCPSSDSDSEASCSTPNWRMTMTTPLSVFLTTPLSVFLTTLVVFASFCHAEHTEHAEHAEHAGVATACSGCFGRGLSNC